MYAVYSLTLSQYQIILHILITKLGITVSNNEITYNINAS